THAYVFARRAVFLTRTERSLQRGGGSVLVCGRAGRCRRQIHDCPQRGGCSDDHGDGEEQVRVMRWPALSVGVALVVALGVSLYISSARADKPPRSQQQPPAAYAPMVITREDYQWRWDPNKGYL